MTKSKLPKIQGKQAKSAYEITAFKQAESLIPVGSTLEYEAEKLPYVTESNYIPDLLVTLRDGRKIYIEVKGNGRQFDYATRAKMIAVKAQHPDKDIRILFYANGRISGTRKRKRGGYYTQAEWAERNGFVYAIKDIPKEWFI